MHEASQILGLQWRLGCSNCSIWMSRMSRMSRGLATGWPRTKADGQSIARQFRWILGILSFFEFGSLFGSFESGSPSESKFPKLCHQIKLGFVPPNFRSTSSPGAQKLNVIARANQTDKILTVGSCRRKG